VRIIPEIMLLTEELAPSVNMAPMNSENPLNTSEPDPGR